MSSGKQNSPFKLPHASTFFAGHVGWTFGENNFIMEIALAPGTVTITKMEFREVASAINYPSVDQGLNPHSIQTDQDIQVLVDWSQAGAIFGGFSGDKWEIELLPEKKGAGEYAGPALMTTEPYVLGNPHAYSKVMTVPAGALSPGVYEFVIRLALRDNSGLYPIVAFQSVGYTQIFNA